jgi:transcriptional regulator with XRE-family HTH domain
MGSDQGSHPGDLGRRVRHRREELGLTRAQVAARAGIDEEVVTFIEEEPAAVGAETILRLAYALDVPDFSLLGSDADVPPEFGGRRPGLEVLAVGECWRLLDDHGVGRIAFLAEPGDPPYVHPMNYAVRDGCVVLVSSTARWAGSRRAARPASRLTTSMMRSTKAGVCCCEGLPCLKRATGLLTSSRGRAEWRSVRSA